jgi:hypothetical protein
MASRRRRPSESSTDSDEDSNPFASPVFARKQKAPAKKPEPVDSDEDGAVSLDALREERRSRNDAFMRSINPRVAAEVSMGDSDDDRPQAASSSNPRGNGAAGEGSDGVGAATRASSLFTSKRKTSVTHQPELAESADEEEVQPAAPIARSRISRFAAPAAPVAPPPAPVPHRTASTTARKTAAAIRIQCACRQWLARRRYAVLLEAKIEREEEERAAAAKAQVEEGLRLIDRYVCVTNDMYVPNSMPHKLELY